MKGPLLGSMFVWQSVAQTSRTQPGQYSRILAEPQPFIKGTDAAAS